MPGGRRASAKPRSGRAGSSADPLPLPAPDPPVRVVPGQPPPGKVDSDDDGIVGLEPGDGVGGQDTGNVAKLRLSPDWVASFDGCFVAFKDYQKPNGGVYQNWKLLCPRHQEGDPCVKTKGCLPKLTEAFGSIGPLAFLHALMPLECDGPHNKTNPTMPQIVAMVNAHKADLEDAEARARAASR